MNFLRAFAGPAVVAALIAGAVSITLHWLSASEIKEQEDRNQLIETYLQFLARQGTSANTEIEVESLASRYRVLVFGDSDVVKQLAAGYKAQADYVPLRDKQEPNIGETESKPLCQCAVVLNNETQLWWETQQSEDVVRKNVRPFMTMRTLYRPKDSIDVKDAMRIVCPQKGLCYSVCYVSHLVDCKRAR